MASPSPEEAPPREIPSVEPMTVTERSRLYTELVRAGVIVEYNSISYGKPVRYVVFANDTYQREPGAPTQALMEWLSIPLRWWDWHKKGPRYKNRGTGQWQNRLAGHSAN